MLRSIKCIMMRYFWRITFVAILILISISIIIYLNQPQLNKECFVSSISSNYDNLLTDILESKILPKPGKSIFFHETSCSSDNILKLNARQACAIESAAKMTPNWEVFVLFASPVGFSNQTDSSIINALQSYSNIHFRNVNLWNYAVNTPIFDWIQDGKIFYSNFVNSHVSDFLRYISLYKWGGTYLDLDVIVKENLNTLPPNYAGAESENFVAAGVINFDHNGFGHEIAEMCLRDFQINFDGREWGNNGPGVITRVLNRVCQTEKPFYMTRDRCHGFNVFPVNTFYAVEWRNWNYFFDEKYTNQTLHITKNSTIIHVWNKHSSKNLIRMGSQAAYGMFANNYCPRVYKASGEYF